MPRLVPALALALVVANPVATQDVDLPIHDLVERAAVGFEPAHWIRHLGDGYGRRDILTGEQQLLADARARAWLQRAELRDMLEILAQVDGGDLGLGAATLTVSSEHVARAREALLWIRQQLPPRIALEVALERVGDDGSTVLLRSAETVRSGSTVTFSDVVTQPMIRDFDVEIAQSGMIANPIVSSLAIGSCLAVRARVVPGEDRAVLEVVARTAERAAATPIALLHPGFGELERAAREIDECGVGFAVPRGATRTLEWTGRDGKQLRLTCKASWEDVPPSPRRDVVVRMSGLISKPVLDFESEVLREDPPDAKARSSIVEAAMRRANERGARVAGDSETSTGAVAYVGDDASAIDASIVAAIAGTVIPARVEIVVHDVAADAELGRTPPAQGALARIAAPVLVGRTASVSGRAEMIYIADWDTEVAQAARIPDPKPGVVASGYRFDVRVIGNPGGGLDLIALDGALERLERIDTSTVPLDVPMTAGGTASGNARATTPLMILPRDVVAIERPVVHRYPITGLVPLGDDGRAVIRRAAPRLFGPGRDLVVFVRVVPDGD